MAKGEGFVIGEEGDDPFGEGVGIRPAGVFEGDLFGEGVFLLHESRGSVERRGARLPSRAFSR